jgi:hypothetical protein
MYGTHPVVSTAMAADRQRELRRFRGARRSRRPRRLRSWFTTSIR